MESGIQEAVIELLNELTALVNKANQLLDVVIRQENEDQERPTPARRRPGVR